jgi:hypothetical protein
MFELHDGPELINPRRQESVTLIGCPHLPARGVSLAVKRL